MRASSKSFGLKWILTFQIPLKYVACHSCDYFRCEACGIYFASAGDAARCCQGDKNKIASAKTGRWISYNIALKVYKLHDAFSSQMECGHCTWYLTDCLTLCQLRAKYHEKRAYSLVRSCQSYAFSPIYEPLCTITNPDLLQAKSRLI